MKELPAIVRALLAPGAPPAVLATLVAVEGSSYRRPGARLLATADGERIGSISGGCLEEDVMARAAHVHSSGQPEVVVYDTTSENDLVWGVGLGCHGIVRVLLEKITAPPPWAQAMARNSVARRKTALAVTHGGDDPSTWGTRLAAPGDCADPDRLFLELVSPPTSLIIFGAGDDAQPLARLANELGWRVTVADPRPAFATPARFPTAGMCVALPASELMGHINPEPEALVVIMTHHYVHDLPLLRDALARPLAYVGLLGPKKRAEKILADLTAAGASLSAERKAQLHAPVGLDLGADSPEQVAVSILAEMQAALHGRDGRPLRERTRPIHE